MSFIVNAFKGQVYVFAGRVKLLSHSSCRTRAILKYFCTLLSRSRINSVYSIYDVITHSYKRFNEPISLTKLLAYVLFFIYLFFFHYESMRENDTGRCGQNATRS